jgi:hypothetical protein
MFRTLEEHAERFHGKTSTLTKIVRFNVLMISSVLVIGTLLTVLIGLD